MPRQRRLMNQINVVPYIDVMLVLLVIFMVTAPMIQTTTVDVPSVGGAPNPTKTEAIIVLMQPGERLEYRPTAAAPQESIDRKQLLAKVTEATRANPDQPVVISADKGLKYEAVMDMLNDLRKAGARKISLDAKADGDR
ncbi:MAG: ExbD/TolR family protein [Rhodocyclaceae bacterium]|jgi:biopolymer transport protein TolR|nr:ExbD/TolR family protein [Rhodocyclaceae bacterium]